MANNQDWTVGKIIETEIMYFLRDFSQSRCGNHVPVLLFPTGLPHNILRVIRYVAMLFDLIAIRVGPEGAKTIVIVYPHHLRLPYRQFIGYYFGYEDVLYNTPYIYEHFRDMLKWSFIKYIERNQRNRMKFASILKIMRKIPQIPEDQEVSTSEDETNSDTSAYDEAAPGTSADVGEPTPTTSAGATENIPQNLPDDQEVSTSEDESTSDTSAYDPAAPSTSADDDEPTPTISAGTTQNRTVEPSGFNVYANEFIPAPEPRRETLSWADWTKMIPSRQLINEIYQYVGCSIIVVAKLNYSRFIARSVYNMDYVIELSHNLNWLILNDGSHRLSSIKKIYQENPYYVKFFDHKSLLVGRSVSQARRLLAVRNNEIQARPFDQANPLCVLLAYYCRLAPARGHNL